MPPMSQPQPDLRSTGSSRLSLHCVLPLLGILGLGLLGATCGESEPQDGVEEPAARTIETNIPVEGYTGNPAPDSVRLSQQRVDPSKTAWITETVHEAAKEELRDFMHKLGSASQTAGLERNTTKEFAGTSAWVPSQLETTMDDGTLLVEKGTQFSREQFPREDLVRVSQELLAAFGWTAQEREQAGIELHTKSKIFTTNLVPGRKDRVLTKALIKLDGPTKAGHALLIEMQWSIEWSVAETRGSTPRTLIRAIQLDSYTRVQNREQTIFAEVTGHVFQSVPRFDAEFLVGTSKYHHHIDLMDENIFAGQIGLAVGDVDGDGLEDLFIPQQGGHPNRLLKHMPDGTLKDISDASGVNLLEGCQSALILDFDNDGHADIAMARHNLLVVGYGDGTGKFELIRPVSAGLDKIKSLAAADWDQDGDLDIYACMYSKEGPLGTIPVPYQDAINGPPNVAWRNSPGEARPRDRWTDVTSELGFDHNNNKFSYGAVWEDFDSDGDLDLYVANDFGSNNLYRNENGHFEDVAREMGVQDIAAGMGVSVGDVDSDGDMDIYVTNMWSSAGRRITTQADLFLEGKSDERVDQMVRHARGNTLFLNNGDGSFTDNTEESGAMNGGWAWGAMLVDMNNNGLLDIYSPNGFITGSVKDDL